MDPTCKRQRADTVPGQNSTSAIDQAPLATDVPDYDLSGCIETLHAADDGAYLKEVLLALASSEPATALVLRRAYDKHIRLEQSKVIDFDHYSKSVFYKIKNQYQSMSGSKQYDVSFLVVYEVSDIIRLIGKQAGAEHACFETKCSGLETLRKIGKTICMSSTDTLGHEVLKQFGHDSLFVDAMHEIVGAMSEEECEKMCEVNDGRSTFSRKMTELCRLADDHCVFEGLEDVIATLSGQDEEEEGREYEKEDDGEEEDQAEVEDEEEAIDYGHGLRFANKREEELYLHCWDEDGAAKKDARSQMIISWYR
jgi:hypothetical protein